MNKCVERVNDRHFWNPGVFSYAMIPKCRPNSRVYFSSSHLWSMRETYHPWHLVRKKQEVQGSPPPSASSWTWTKTCSLTWTLLCPRRTSPRRSARSPRLTGCSYHLHTGQVDKKTCERDFCASDAYDSPHLYRKQRTKTPLSAWCISTSNSTRKDDLAKILNISFIK